MPGNNNTADPSTLSPSTPASIIEEPGWLTEWAQCEDKSEEIVVKKAAEFGLADYSCARGLREGLCALGDLAKELCPATCKLCKVPPPDTSCRVSESGSFCLASTQWCNTNTNCGEPIKNAIACRAAAAELGLNSSVIELKSPDAPYGCFQTRLDDQQAQVYHNKDGIGCIRAHCSDALFVKALCLTPKSGGAAAKATTQPSMAHSRFLSWFCRF